MTGSTHVRVTLALVLAVSLAGCGAVDVPGLGGDDAAGDGEATEIATDAVAKMQNVSSYNFTMTNEVRFNQNLVNVSADGSVNHTTERLYMDSVLTLQTNTTRSKEFTEVYVLGDTHCRNLDADETGTGQSGWNVSNAAADPWNQGLSLADQGRILNASGTTAVQLPNETVRGQDAYVVRVSPDATTLKRVVANGSDVDFSNVVVRNATITQYVAQDDGRLLRSEMTVRYVVDGRRTTADVTMTYSDYGDVDPIRPPKDARQAGCTQNGSATSVAA